MKTYKAIGSYYKVLIPPEKRPKAYKVKARTELGRLLTVLKSKTYLVYISTRNTVIKTPFIKLYKPKNPLILEGVSKPIKIRPLNDVVIIEDSTGKKILLDLPETDNIGSSKLTTPKAPGPPEPPALRPSRLPKPENRPLKPVLRPFEEPIKPIDSSDPDKI